MPVRVASSAAIRLKYSSRPPITVRKSGGLLFATATEVSMTTSPVSNQSASQDIRAFHQNRSADLNAIGQALQSGDLNGAQSAFATLLATWNKPQTAPPPSPATVVTLGPMPPI